MTKRQNQADEAAQRYLDTERSLTTRTRPWHLSLLVLCGLLVLSLGLALCFLPHEDYSPTEKRSLASAPEFSLDALLSGELMRDLSDFCADQFALRSHFVQAKAGIELLLGKQQNNGVIPGKDGYLFTRADVTADTKEALLENVRAVKMLDKTLTQAGIPFDFAVVPRSVDVNRDRLPALYDTAEADTVWRDLEAAIGTEHAMLNLTEPLRRRAQAGEAVWYKTDHHWTTLGAYYAYVALADTLGYVPFPLSDFEQTVVCDDFYGTTYAASGMHWMAGDSITLFRFAGDDAWQTTVIEGGKLALTLDGLYDMSALETRDQYEVFLGGTHTRIEVTPKDGEVLPTLLLLKDSYAQSLAPFLARHYRLILIDPRTYKSMSTTLPDAVLSERPDHVLLLCGVQTLGESGALKSLALSK